MTDSSNRISRLRAQRGSAIRVAIIGTGIAGETALHIFSQPENAGLVEICRVYEARKRPGLHDNSITIGEGGYRVDVPLRAVSPHYYANLTKLYQHLRVDLQRVDYSFNTDVFPPPSPAQPSSSPFQYWNLNLPRWLGGLSIPLPTKSSLNMRSYRIIRDLLFLTSTGSVTLKSYKRKQASSSSATAESLGSYLRNHRYSTEFIHGFLYPMLSTMLSCTLTQVEAYPAEFILEFFCSRRTAMLAQWYRVAKGVEEVSDKLLSKVPKEAFTFGVAAESVVYDDVHDVVVVRDATGNEATYDVVIIATEPPVAQRIWKGVDATEGGFLSSLDAHSARITVHRDASLMPEVRSLWRGINLFSNPSQNASMTTAWLEKFHPMLPKHERKDKDHEASSMWFETWNAFQEPKDGTILSDVILTRAVWHTRTKDAYDKSFVQGVQGRRGVYLIGSYTEPGLTLLEQAVTSGLRVAEQLGCQLPFSVEPTYQEPVWPFYRLISTIVYGLWWTLPF